ncbi:unnamed protein product [Auanema sp. JU1783]|nr:unnamed protein product [Auanema sp. JU1783]
MPSENNRNCAICAKDFASKSALHHHVLKHLGYRRYSCSSCSTCFYTEEEREEHCRETSHINMFEMKINQYNEMLVKQVLRDIDVSAKFDLDFVIRERARAALTYEKAVEDSPPPVMKRSQPSFSSPSSTNRSITRCSPAPADPSSDNNESPPRKRKTSVRTPEPRKSNSASESNTTADEFDRIPTAEGITASELVDLSLTSKTEKIRCKLCRTRVESSYVTRKNHVSLLHMPNNHNETDYVDILEHKMQEAFPGSPYSDYQCQFPNCFKIYKSQSSRRSHVLSCHFNCQIECPMEECCAVFTDAFKAHTHLKVEHKLVDGAKSMKNTVLKYKFEYEKRAHNSKLEQTVRQAFPCPIPVLSKGSDKDVGKDSIIRDGPDRLFERLPPAPRRARSSSSSGSEESPLKTPLGSSTPKRDSVTENRKEFRKLETELKQANNSCHSESPTPASLKADKKSSKSDKKRTNENQNGTEGGTGLKRVKLEPGLAENGHEESSHVGSLVSDFKEVDDPDNQDSKSHESGKAEIANSDFQYESKKRKPLLATPPCTKKLSGSPTVTFRFTPKYTSLTNSILKHVSNHKSC